MSLDIPLMAQGSMYFRPGGWLAAKVDIRSEADIVPENFSCASGLTPKINDDERKALAKYSQLPLHMQVMAA